MGIVVWPMIDSAAHLASKQEGRESRHLDAPQGSGAMRARYARGADRGRRKIIRDAAGIREKFGVDPPLISDLLALVRNAADGYPGIPGIGPPIVTLPSNILGQQRKVALLLKNLATLRTDASLQSVGCCAGAVRRLRSPRGWRKWTRRDSSSGRKRRRIIDSARETRFIT
jgi:hypothetical protein